MAADAPAAAQSKVDLPRTLKLRRSGQGLLGLPQGEPSYFKYLKEGRVVGKFTMSDREEEWVDFGGGDKTVKTRSYRPL